MASMYFYVLYIFPLWLTSSCESIESVKFVNLVIGSIEFPFELEKLIGCIMGVSEARSVRYTVTVVYK